MNENDLRYLLKEKYNYNETQLLELKIGKIRIVNKEIEEDIKKLEEGVPVAYLIGYVEFLNTRINLNYRTLIPRPETEYWIEIYINKLKHQNLQILDIFCGSGCIGIALAKNLPLAHITLTDISDEAINQTTENAKINDISLQKIEIIKSNIFESIPKKKFDYIFANPPYVENIYMKMGDRGLKYEPATALFGGEDGMQVIEKFIDKLIDYLAKNGTCIMEFGDNQQDKVKEILLKNKFNKFEFFKDQFGVIRWVEIKNS
jgi:release factor glutamine methyltransferase